MVETTRLFCDERSTRVVINIDLVFSNNSGGKELSSADSYLI